MRKLLSLLLALLLALQLCSPAWAQIVMPGGGAGSIASVASTCPATTTSSGAATVPNGVTSIAKSSAYTILPADCGKFFEVTGNTTITLPGFSGGGSVGSGFSVIIQNAGTGTVTITASSGSIFNGSTGTSVTITSSGQQVGLVVNSSISGWDATPASISAATIIGPGYQVGPFYVPFMEPPQATAAAALSISTAYCRPIWFNNIVNTGGGTGTIGQLYIHLGVVGTTNTTAALYANDPAANPFRPGALLTNGATPQTQNTVGASFAGLIPYVTGPSVSANTLYWGCLQTGDTTMTYGLLATTQGAPTITFVGSSTAGSSGAGSSVTNGVSVSVGSFGTWPSNLHGSTFTEGGNGRVPWLGFQFSSIP